MASELSRKLRITPGSRVLVLNTPPHYASLIEPLSESGELSDIPEDGAFGVVHAFVANQADLERFGPAALRAAKPDSVVWFSYPKRASKIPTDITRDSGWGVLEETGWRPVVQISVDDVWSASRFRPR